MIGNLNLNFKQLRIAKTILTELANGCMCQKRSFNYLTLTVRTLWALAIEVITHNDRDLRTEEGRIVKPHVFSVVFIKQKWLFLMKKTEIASALR